jgi:hypothetical protein
MTIYQFAIATRRTTVRTLRLFALSVTAALLTAFAAQVSEVYAARLGMPIIVVGTSTITTPHFVTSGSGVKLPLAPSPSSAAAESFFSRSLTAIQANPARLVWSAYPASIRGQVFSGKTATDPFSSSGGW